MTTRVAIGFYATFLVAACGGADAPSPKTPVSPAPAPAAAASAPVATPSAWTLPEGPRDAEKTPPAVPAYKLETWKSAIGKVKGVPAPAAECKDWQKRTASENDEATAKKAAAGDVPPGCADAIVDRFLLDPKRGDATDETSHRLVGLSLAGRLARTAASAPVMKDASDKEKVKKFIQGPLRTWMMEQATAIDTLSAAGTTLAPAGRAIVATEAGMADLRLVDKIRSAPTPSTWDKELKAVYEAALDEALEPRKTRGRDAALVGLSDFAALGVATDARVDRARALLSKMYGGRRVDALDGLFLPKESPAIARSWPRFELGRKYWRKVDFVEAAHAAAKEEGDDARLVLALSLALAHGPNSVKDMMAAPSPATLGLDRTDALDDLAAKGGLNAGDAAYDAAYLRSLAVPDGAAASAHLTDVASRAHKAAALLTDPAKKKAAEQLATDTEAAAKATK
ncbi:MAG: hypothetical protein KIT84_29960 [Labilithrix sp.]|nr:hypothetical protein [Labilithrix sp.]MCW5815289.1 hypothetical protein [Labilithrix sp.]